VTSINANSSHQELLAIAERLVEAVADSLSSREGSGMTGAREGQYKIDVAANEAALKVLHDAQIKVLSEESGVEAIVWPIVGDEIFAILDPLDGSTNADRGIPWYSTSVAFVDRDGVCAAMIANQANGDRFSAIRGEGAFRNGERIKVSGRTLLSECVVGLSGIPNRNPGWWQFRALGSAALDLCLVAMGALDAWVDCESHGVWDYAGGILIVTEAGGVVAEVFGADLIHADYNARRTPIAAASDRLLSDLIGFRNE